MVDRKSDENIKFRNRKEWKNFRESILGERGPVCELCGTRFSGKQKKMLQVHHLSPESYEDLDPEKFRLVCSTDHRLIEKMSRKIMSKNPQIRNFEQWLDLLWDFLPFDVRERARELREVK